MTADDFMSHLPPDLRAEFLTWLAKRDRKIGLREFRSGYDHGWHDGQQDNGRIS